MLRDEKSLEWLKTAFAVAAMMALSGVAWANIIYSKHSDAERISLSFSALLKR